MKFICTQAGRYIPLSRVHAAVPIETGDIALYGAFDSETVHTERLGYVSQDDWSETIEQAVIVPAPPDTQMVFGDNGELFVMGRAYALGLGREGSAYVYGVSGRDPGCVGILLSDGSVELINDGVFASLDEAREYTKTAHERLQAFLAEMPPSE